MVHHPLLSRLHSWSTATVVCVCPATSPSTHWAVSLGQPRTSLHREDLTHGLFICRLFLSGPSVTGRPLALLFPKNIPAHGVFHLGLGPKASGLSRTDILCLKGDNQLWALRGKKPRGVCMVCMGMGARSSWGLRLYIHVLPWVGGKEDRGGRGVRAPGAQTWRDC